MNINFIGHLKMKIKIRLFLDFKEIIGKKELKLEIKREVTIRELIELLEKSYPKIKKVTKYPENYSILLNSTYSKLTANLKENDVIDLFSVIDGG